MDHLEMVEKLREKANVSYEEANEALEACDWDLLDALLMLESKGKLNEMEEAAYSTRGEQQKAEQTAGSRRSHQPGIIASLLRGLGSLIKKGNAVSVQISKNGEIRLSLPLTAVVIAMIFMFWWMIGAVLISMIFGYRYSIQGLSVDDTVNSAMEKAGDFVHSATHPEDVKIVHDEEEAKPDEDNQ